MKVLFRSSLKKMDQKSACKHRHAMVTGSMTPNLAAFLPTATSNVQDCTKSVNRGCVGGGFHIAGYVFRSSADEGKLKFG